MKPTEVKAIASLLLEYQDRILARLGRQPVADWAVRLVKNAAVHLPGRLLHLEDGQAAAFALWDVREGRAILKWHFASPRWLEAADWRGELQRRVIAELEADPTIRSVEVRFTVPPALLEDDTAEHTETLGLERLDAVIVEAPTQAPHPSVRRRDTLTVPEADRLAEANARAMAPGYRLEYWNDLHSERALDVVAAAWDPVATALGYDRADHAEALRAFVRQERPPTFDIDVSGVAFAPDGRTIVGVIVASVPTATIGHLAVHPDHRGRGLGRALFARCLSGYARRGFETCRLTVPTAVPALAAFWQRFHLREVGPAPIWYKVFTR